MANPNANTKGPPAVRKVEEYEKYLENLRKGKRRTESADMAGISLKQVQNRRRVDPAFAEAEQLAEEQACDVIEQVMWNLAKQGNFPSIQMWLERRGGDRWRKPADRVEVDQRIELEAGPALERITALVARLEERKAILAEVIDVEELPSGSESEDVL